VAAKKKQCPLLSNTVAEMPTATAAVTTAAAKRPLDAAATTASFDAAADTHGDLNAEAGDWLDSVHSPPGPSPELAPAEDADGDMLGLVSISNEDEDPALAIEPAPASDL
jgi:hypothetical protein